MMIPTSDKVKAWVGLANNPHTLSDIKAHISRHLVEWEYCPECYRPTVYPGPEYPTENFCASCRCISCGGYAYLHKGHTITVVSCDKVICKKTAENLIDLKKQWFALRCLNRTSRHLFNYNVLPKPLLQIDEFGHHVRSFLDENIDDLNKFIQYLVGV